ncbi:MAG: shikimate kinase [Bacteroidales bacterium]
MRIYLIGFMGSGKSTLGKRLARRLDYGFQDLDHEVEKNQGMSVGEIFSKHGEAYFRKLEQKQLHETALHDNMVIATGGGTPCFFDNMDFIIRSGMSVYLRMSHLSLAHRLENAFTRRPLLDDLQGEPLQQYIAQKLQEREPYYLQAHCIIKGETVKPDHIISLVFGES